MRTLPAFAGLCLLLPLFATAAPFELRDREGRLTTSPSKLSFPRKREPRAVTSNTPFGDTALDILPLFRSWVRVIVGRQTRSLSFPGMP